MRIARIRRVAGRVKRAEEIASGATGAVETGLRREGAARVAAKWGSRLARKPLKTAAIGAIRSGRFLKKHPIATASIALDLGLQSAELAHQIKKWRAQRKAAQ